MSPVPVNLPGLPDLRRRWAALTAVLSATGLGRGCFAEGRRWHYDDGGGNWTDLVFLAQGPVLLGHDHEYSETYFRVPRSTTNWSTRPSSLPRSASCRPGSGPLSYSGSSRT